MQGKSVECEKKKSPSGGSSGGVSAVVRSDVSAGEM